MERYRATEGERRNPSVLGGFLRAAAPKDKARVDDLLDAAVRDPLLGPVFPDLQASVGIDEDGARRLIASVESRLASPRIYWNLALGRTTDTIPPAALSRIVLGIAGLPDGGHGVAVEILHMHFHGGRGEQSAWDPLLIDCGRRVLASYPLDQVNHHEAYKLAKIARVCLSNSESAIDVTGLCHGVSDALKNRRTSWWELRELMKALFALHPLVALDCWVAGWRDERRHYDLHFFNGTADHNPVNVVPVSILLEWADGDPDTRFPRLAGIIPALGQKDGVTTWSEGALALLRAGPDRAAVLRALATQLHQSSGSGSLADILERRRPLLQELLADDDPAVRQAAREIDDGLQQEIESERSLEVNRDERFE